MSRGGIVNEDDEALIEKWVEDARGNQRIRRCKS